MVFCVFPSGVVTPICPEQKMSSKTQTEISTRHTNHKQDRRTAAQFCSLEALTKVLFLAFAHSMCTLFLIELLSSQVFVSRAKDQRETLKEERRETEERPRQLWIRGGESVQGHLPICAVEPDAKRLVTNRAPVDCPHVQMKNSFLCKLGAKFRFHFQMEQGIWISRCMSFPAGLARDLCLMQAQLLSMAWLGVASYLQLGDRHCEPGREPNVSVID